VMAQPLKHPQSESAGGLTPPPKIGRPRTILPPRRLQVCAGSLLTSDKLPKVPISHLAEI